MHSVFISSNIRTLIFHVCGYGIVMKIYFIGTLNYPVLKITLVAFTLKTFFKNYKRSEAIICIQTDNNKKV